MLGKNEGFFVTGSFGNDDASLSLGVFGGGGNMFMMGAINVTDLFKGNLTFEPGYLQELGGANSFSGRSRAGERVRQHFSLTQHLFHEGGDAVKRARHLFGDADFQHDVHDVRHANPLLLFKGPAGAARD